MKLSLNLPKRDVFILSALGEIDLSKFRVASYGRLAHSECIAFLIAVSSKG